MSISSDSFTSECNVDMETVFDYGPTYEFNGLIQSVICMIIATNQV